MATNARPTLEIPEGAVFELEQDGLVIGFRDDVVIRGNIGHRLKKVWSENGTIELRSPQELVVETVETRRGTVIIAGAVRAKSIKGAKVALIEGSLAARSVNGETQIDLRGGVIEADLVMSPEVLVSPQVRGRATVIECQNDIGPHQLKGGFKMAEFLEMMPNAQKVIQSEASHVPQLSAGNQPRTPQPTIPPAPQAATFTARAAVAEETSEPVPQSAPVEEPTGPSETQAAADGGAPAADASGYFDGSPDASASTQPGEADAYASGDTQSEVPAATEAPAPEPEPEPPPPERPPFHATLAEMCDQVGRVYSAQNLQVPPPVARLITMIDAGEYSSVKSQLTTIWNQLIQYHKESKLPFAVKTTQIFQGIQRTLSQNVQ